MADLPVSPNSDYNPEMGNLMDEGGAIGAQYSPTRGYSNIGLLRSNLEKIENQSIEIIDICETTLRKMSLDLSRNEDLISAQEVEWPSELGAARDFLTYDQYRALSKSKTRGANFLRQAYEYYLRGPAGTVAIDVLGMSNIIKSEAVAIGSFLDKYLGEIDDSSEYRVLEFFQDWTEIALRFTGSFRSFIEEEGKGQSTLSGEEIDRLSKNDAAHYQHLFQVKVNTINGEVVQVYEDLNREYSDYSPVFYDQFLGPALKYQVTTGRHMNKTNVAGFLQGQSVSAKASFGGHFSSVLADQMRRNNLFEKKVTDLSVRLVLREQYRSSIKSLESKGRKIKTSFIDATLNDEEGQFFSEIVDKETTDNKFLSAHNYIPDRENDEAHPQYILKAGDTVSGDINLDTGVLVGGMEPGEHKHLGQDIDGTHQLDAAESILPETLVASLVKEELIDQPTSLRLVEEKICTNNGRPVINIKLGWEGADEEEYEVQIVALCDDEEDQAGCIEGHLFEYPAVTCDHSATDRIYLNNGFDPGSFVGGEPLVWETESPQYETRNSLVLPLDDEYFVVGLDFRNHFDFGLALGRRTGSGSEDLEWDEKDQLSLAVSNTLPQQAVAAVQVNTTEFLVGAHQLDAPAIFLVNRDLDDLELVTGAYLATWGDFTWSGGVHDIEMLEDRKFVVAFYTEDTGSGGGGGSGPPPYAAKLLVGELDFTPGSSFLSEMTVDLDDVLEFSSGFARVNYIQVIALTSTKIAVLWGEEEDGPTYDAGYYIQVLNVTGTTISNPDPEKSHKLVDWDVAQGRPQLKRINNSRFVVVYAESNTSSCEG